MANKHNPDKWKKAIRLLRAGHSIGVAGYVSGVGKSPLSHQLRRVSRIQNGIPGQAGQGMVGRQNMIRFEQMEKGEDIGQMPQ